MRTTLERSEVTIPRDGSTFIGILVHVTSLQSIEQYLADIKKQYPKAKHYCYAYRLGQYQKCSDDGEPAKTAGRPIMEVLEKKNLEEVLLVVVRYFGGTLLGASRLLSTYVETASKTIENADLVDIETKYVFQMTLSYSEYEQLRVYTRKKSFLLENVQFLDKIKVDVLADEESDEELVNLFPHASIEVIGTKKVYRR